MKKTAISGKHHEDRRTDREDHSNTIWYLTAIGGSMRSLPLPQRFTAQEPCLHGVLPGVARQTELGLSRNSTSRIVSSSLTANLLWKKSRDQDLRTTMWIMQVGISDAVGGGIPFNPVSSSPRGMAITDMFESMAGNRKHGAPHDNILRVVRNIPEIADLIPVPAGEKWYTFQRDQVNALQSLQDQLTVRTLPDESERYRVTETMRLSGRMCTVKCRKLK